MQPQKCHQVVGRQLNALKCSSVEKLKYQNNRFHTELNRLLPAVATVIHDLDIT